MFESVIIIALLIAMLGSNQPYKFAIILVVVTAVFARLIDDYGLYWAESFVSLISWLYISEPSWIPWYLIFIFQTLMAGVLILYTFALSEKRERGFFLLMAVFMLFNCALMPAYKADLIVAFETYVLLYHTTAILQVLTVFYYTNGSTKLIANIRNSIHRYNVRVSSVRS